MIKTKYGEPGVSADVTPFCEFFRFIPGPDSPQSGKAFTPLMGEVEPGGVYAVNDRTRANTLADHPEWDKVSEREYKAYLNQQEDQED